MKGISNRQKMIVRPRESVSKYLSQQKEAQRSAARTKDVERRLRRDRSGKSPSG
ncbi:MAG TPA: hypothetical protein VMH23_08400 [Bacteroidota bacterium]|nr:hypothetical protein [Bacteroidota bacterium]